MDEEVEREQHPDEQHGAFPDLDLVVGENEGKADHSNQHERALTTQRQQAGSDRGDQRRSSEHEGHIGDVGSHDIGHGHIDLVLGSCDRRNQQLGDRRAKTDNQSPDQDR